MPKFPTESKRSVTVKVPINRAYKYFWNVTGHAPCIPGLDSCERAGADTNRFTGPVSITVVYTARYQGNGRDEIRYAGSGAKGDNTDIEGVIRLASSGDNATKVSLQQIIAPETPVPRLLQGLMRAFVEKEASEALREFLQNVKRDLEG